MAAVEEGTEGRGIDEAWREGGNEEEKGKGKGRGSWCGPGRLVEGGKVYREQFVVPWYQVGEHKRASIEAVANMLQVNPWYTNAQHSKYPSGAGFPPRGQLLQSEEKLHAQAWES